MSEVADALDDLDGLWRMERQASRRRALEERLQLPLAERVRRGLALEGLEVTDTDAAPGGRTMVEIRPRSPKVDLEVARIGQGDPVRLWLEDPDGPGVARGVVSRRLRDRLRVVLDADPPEFLDEGGFRLDVDAPEATFDRGERALRVFGQLKAHDPRAALRDVLFGSREATFTTPTPAEPLDRSLNEPQRLAVERALSADAISLVLGPPGTGKTRTLAEVVRRAVARSERVLVTAASNLAVDNLAERLVSAGEPVLRLGHPARVLPSVEAATLDALLEATEQHRLAHRWVREAQQLRRKTWAKFSRRSIGHRERRAALAEAGRLMRDARKLVDSAKVAVLLRHPIVCATAAGADVSLLSGVRFDRVVIDEATQATDPIALVALARASRATLAGDPFQLPPTVIDQEAERAGLGRTFFERLCERGGPPQLVTMLEVQHRMHEVLMRFPSEQMYSGRLRAHEGVRTHRLEDLEGVAPDPLRRGPFVFMDTAGKGWAERRAADDPSTDNPGQARRVAAEAVRLLGRGLPAADLAVITPYLAEVRMLRDLLAEPVAAGLEVGTVDGFQGREKEAVILDLVRSNDDGELGFLSDVRRMNVAITRARRFLLVVGDSATLGSHPFYQAFLAHAEAQGAHLSAWSDDAPPFDPGQAAG